MIVYLSTKADRQLRKLPKKMHQLLIDRIRMLDQQPFPSQSKKLVDRLGWRFRVVDYRILYTVCKKSVTVLSVAHRREAYRF